MKKKVVILVVIIVFLVLFVLPLNIGFVTDGGSMIFRPIVCDWYVICKYNALSTEEPIMAHDDPNYQPPKFFRIKGTKIIVFGQVLYDHKYEVH